MLELRSVCAGYGTFQALFDVSLDVNAGEAVGVIGPNGAGKTTLMRLIADDLTPQAGTVSSSGGLGVMRQFIGQIADDSTLHDLALSLAPPAVRAAGERLAAAEKALGLVGLPTDARAGTDGLGAAALKKLELARALATRPRLLLADESLNGLDYAEMDQAADMLRRIRDQMRITIVWVEHIMGVLMRMVDRVVVLDHGEKIFDGPPKAAQSNRRVIEVYLGPDQD